MKVQITKNIDVKITTLYSVCLLAILFFFSCNSFFDDDKAAEKIENINLTVASNTILIVPMNNDGNLHIIYQFLKMEKKRTLPLKWIKGFDYEKG